MAAFDHRRVNFVESLVIFGPIIQLQRHELHFSAVHAALIVDVRCIAK
jgi:hypothetical protein